MAKLYLPAGGAPAIQDKQSSFQGLRKVIKQGKVYGRDMEDIYLGIWGK